MPDFPMLDVMDIPDDHMEPYLIHSPCNWQQVSENSMDPFHVSFLHTRVAGPQFSEVFGQLPRLRQLSVNFVDFHFFPRPK